MDTLKAELETYKTHLPKLTGSEGKFVLISGADVLGTTTHITTRSRLSMRSWA
jgi:hypothetical protein